MGRCDELLNTWLLSRGSPRGEIRHRSTSYIVEVPTEREPLLHKHAKAIFEKLEASKRATCDIKIIIDPLDVSDYFAKQFDCGETILANKTRSGE